MKKIALLTLLIFSLSINCFAFDPLLVFSGAGATDGGCAGGDGTLGNETNDNGVNPGATDFIVWTPFTVSDPGESDYCHCTTDYLWSSSVNIGVYNSSGVKQVDGTAIATAGTNAEQLDITLDSTFCFLDSTEYWIALGITGSDTDYNLNSNTTAGNIYYDDTDVVIGDTMSTNISSEGSLLAYQIHCWCDNTP